MHPKLQLLAHMASKIPKALEICVCNLLHNLPMHHSPACNTWGALYACQTKLTGAAQLLAVCSDWPK